MRSPFYKKQFKKDYKKQKRKHGKEIRVLEIVMEALICNEQLLEKYNDHKLKGEYKNYRELHVAPDWLLIYELVKDKKGNEVIYFIRTGSHSELFE